MEQYIWESPAGESAARTDAPEDAAVVSIIEPRTDQEAPLPRILVLSDDGGEPQAPDAEPRDEWRRQLISALHDADRERSSAPPAPEPETPPPIPYVEPPQRTPPLSFTPNRPARILAPLPVARAPRHRIGLSLLGISAAAGLLSATLPRSANVPEAPAAAGPPVVLALSPRNAPEAGSDVIKPVMFNSPVLVREGAAPAAGAPVLPVIETVRTVPVPLSREARAPAEPASQQAALLDRSPEPTIAPAAAPASPPVTQDSFATLIAQPSAVPPHKAPTAPAQTLPPPAAVATERQTSPTAAAPEPAAAAAAPATTSKSARRTPQIASSYTRASPKARKQTSKRTTRTTSKSANQTKQAQWEARRQGLRTAPPAAEEPSTVVKVLKSLWPFSSDEDAAKAQAAHKKSEAPQPAKTKNSFWWGEKESDR